MDADDAIRALASAVDKLGQQVAALVSVVGHLPETANIDLKSAKALAGPLSPQPVIRGSISQAYGVEHAIDKVVQIAQQLESVRSAGPSPR